jgi:fructose-1,6-bisphosphatase/inositol monophosphatase family enzyme
MEGFDDPLPVGAGDPAPWTYLVDPVDGTRGYLAGLRSAWVVLGAGRRARSLEDLEVGAAVEIATPRAALTRVAWATRRGASLCVDEPTAASTGVPVEVALQPTTTADPTRTFVTVVRLMAGDHGPIGRWADDHLAGIEAYDDLVPCSAHHLMSVASGSASAVLDPRPLLNPGGMHTHPYDLAALVVYRAAGVIVEALPAGPLDGPLDPDASVAWAAYANPALADRLRPRADAFPAAPLPAG